MRRLLPFLPVFIASACVSIPLPAGMPGGGGGGGGGGAAAGYAATALVLAVFADSAQGAGCEPLLVGAWRDAALELAAAAPDPLPDSLRRLAAEEVGRAMPRIRELCAQSTPRVERLRQIRAELAGPADSVATEPLFAPVYFAPGERAVRDDSVRHRLRALGRRLVERPLPMMLVVEGFAGEDEPAGLALARAQAVVAEMRRGGHTVGCRAAVGRNAAVGRRPPGGEGAFQRRVTFALDYQERAR
jgi:hypothetical protein